MKIEASVSTSRFEVHAAWSRLNGARQRLAADLATGAADHVIRADQAAVAAGHRAVAQSSRGIVLDVLA